MGETLELHCDAAVMLRLREQSNVQVGSNSTRMAAIGGFPGRKVLQPIA